MGFRVCLFRVQSLCRVCLGVGVGLSELRIPLKAESEGMAADGIYVAFPVHFHSSIIAQITNTSPCCSYNITTHSQIFSIFLVPKESELGTAI